MVVSTNIQPKMFLDNKRMLKKLLDVILNKIKRFIPDKMFRSWSHAGVKTGPPVIHQNIDKESVYFARTFPRSSTANEHFQPSTVYYNQNFNEYY